MQFISSEWTHEKITGVPLLIRSWTFFVDMIQLHLFECQLDGICRPFSQFERMCALRCFKCTYDHRVVGAFMQSISKTDIKVQQNGL